MSHPNISISVFIPTHNADPQRLSRTFRALQSQTVPDSIWELLVIDNASDPPLSATHPGAPEGTSVIRESTLGLTAARLRGFRESRGSLIIMVDDDNVLAPDYLERALELADNYPQCGAFGGPSHPEFETTPPAWLKEFHGLLALRDLGNESMLSKIKENPDYPEFSPIGAGMVLRKNALQTWIEQAPDSLLSDRKGASLSSSGDNDIVLSVLKSGYQVGYFPQLSLTHLIPNQRLQVSYLARLNQSIQYSWMQVLYHHGVNPWPKIPRWSFPLRVAKAWFKRKSWMSDPAYIKWFGDRGHFAGRIKTDSH